MYEAIDTGEQDMSEKPEYESDERREDAPKHEETSTPPPTPNTRSLPYICLVDIFANLASREQMEFVYLSYSNSKIAPSPVPQPPLIVISALHKHQDTISHKKQNPIVSKISC